MRVHLFPSAQYKYIYIFESVIELYGIFFFRFTVVIEIIRIAWLDIAAKECGGMKYIPIIFRPIF